MGEQVKKLKFLKDVISGMEIKPSQNNSVALVFVYQTLDEVINALAETDTDEPAVTEADI